MFVCIVVYVILCVCLFVLYGYMCVRCECVWQYVCMYVCVYDDLWMCVRLCCVCLCARGVCEPQNQPFLNLVKNWKEKVLCVV